MAINRQSYEGERQRVKLQPVVLEDIAEIVRMAESVWRRHFPGIISDEQIDYMLAKLYSCEVITEEFISSGVSYRFIVAGDERIGFCAFGTEGKGVMKLHKLYVLPQFQRRGFGKAALSRMEEQFEAQGCSAITLAVNKRNSAAIKAYESWGFQIREAVSVDIGGGFVMDDYVMVKRPS